MKIAFFYISKISYPIKGLILGITFWTFIVIDALVIYNIPGEGWEAAGFLLVILTIPGNYFIDIFFNTNVSLLNQILQMSCLGYFQWGIFGYLFGKIIHWKVNKSV